MPIRNTRTTRNRTARTARTAWKVTEKAAVGLARWATTDHTGTAKFLGNMPATGFIDTLMTVALTVLCSLLGAVVTGASAFLLVAYGIPFLLGM